MTIKIDYTQAVDLLHMAVAERGVGYVYQQNPVYTEHQSDGKGGITSCHYFDSDGEPDCIVGWLLNSLGVKYEMSCVLNHAPAGSLFTEQVLAGDVQTRSLLAMVQWMQDSRWTWGASVLYAQVRTDENLAHLRDLPDYPEIWHAAAVEYFQEKFFATYEVEEARELVDA